MLQEVLCLTVANGMLDKNVWDLLFSIAQMLSCDDQELEGLNGIMKHHLTRAPNTGLELSNARSLKKQGARVRGSYLVGVLWVVVGLVGVWVACWWICAVVGWFCGCLVLLVGWLVVGCLLVGFVGFVVGFVRRLVFP